MGADKAGPSGNQDVLSHDLRSPFGR
jgi:hypothetical protein